MIEQQVEVRIVKGIHARPASQIVKTTSQFTSKIMIGPNESTMVNAKSIIGLLTIGATCGTILTVVIDGGDEVEAWNAVRTLFETMRTTS